MLRKHQKQFLGVIKKIQSGSPIKTIVMVVTPGGGKSFIPVAAGKLIESGHADALAWVVPRQALQDQGEREFIDPFSRKLFNHNLLIRSATNDRDPCRGTNGFITTYQALGVDTKKVISREFSTKRYILILDEYHHVENGGIWHQAIDPLFKQAAYVILMTGTLERGDGKPIAFTEYRNNRPVLESSETTAIIRYNRLDALSEKAILPISFHLSDGQFQWEDQEGNRRGISSFEDAQKTDEAAALYTALKTEFSSELLQICIRHWCEHRQQNKGAKILVVTADYAQAKNISFILQQVAGFKTEIATSHKAKEAVAAIKLFKTGEIDVLVTIAMAYEGLSCPPVTHICSLTHIRSTPWIEQMVARGVRIDKAAGPYESQICYVFAPRDNRMVAIMEQISKEQAPVLGKRSKPEESEFEKAKIPGDGSGTSGPDITPLSSSLTGQTEHIVGLDGFQTEFTFEFEPHPEEMETVKEQEDRMRRQIAKHVNAYAFKHRYQPQQINSEIKHRFGKARELMSLPELERVMAHIKEFYPAEPVKTILEIPPGMDQYSKPRSKRKRVSSKPEKWTPRDEIMKMECYRDFNKNPMAHIYR